MFIEVYAIPVVEYSEQDINTHIKNENLTVISIDDIGMIRPDSCDRAEITLKSNGNKIISVGSFEEVIQRMSGSGVEINRIL